MFTPETLLQLGLLFCQLSSAMAVSPFASGFAHGAVLLDGASLGANAHARPGTLLEERASTAHTVGLKHTLLLSFVTLGSLINFCDCLMAGGRSRRDHSEVGSGSAAEVRIVGEEGASSDGATRLVAPTKPQ